MFRPGPKPLDLSYFEQAIDDFDALGMGIGTLKPPLLNNLSAGNLSILLDRTRSLGSQVPSDEFEPVTSLGQEALRLIEANAIFLEDNESWTTVCGSAEDKLIENVAADSVANPNLRSPVIVTKAKKPVGIIKGMGEATCYGLVTDLAAGLVEGCFSEPMPYEDLGVLVEGLPRVAHGWSLPLEQAGRLAPIRFSAFKIPLEQRLKLLKGDDSQWETQILLGTHQQIVKRAGKILKKAVPLELLSQSLSAAA